MRFLLSILLLLFIYSDCFANQEDRLFIENVQTKNLVQLQQLEKKYLDKNPKPFSNDQLRLKVVQAAIFYQHKETIKVIETLIWMTNNKEITNQEFLTWGHYHLSTTLEYYDILDLAIRHSKTCIELAKRAKNYKILQPAYSNLGMIFYKEKKYDKAIQYFELAEEVPMATASLLKASQCNNIGLSYKNLQQYNKAATAFQKGLSFIPNHTKKGNDELYYLIIGNLGATYLKTGNTGKGFDLLKQELDYYNRSHFESADKASCLIDIIQYYNLSGHTEKCPPLIDQTLNIIMHLDDPQAKNTLIEKLIRLLNEKHIPVNELKLNKCYNEVLIASNNQFKQLQTAISKLFYEEKISSLISRSEFEKRNYSLQQKNERLILYVTFIVITMLILLLIGIVRTNKQRLISSRQKLLIQQQREEIVKNEQIILQQQFENQKQQLNSLLTNLSIKQNTESGFLEKIKDLKRNKNITPEQIIQELQISVNNLMDIDRKLIRENVPNFEINQEFSTNIKQKHPDLNETEIRYCNYFIAGLSSKEIGMLHNLSDISVRVMKNKIKNKLGLHKDDSMIEYLKKFLF